VTRPRRGPDWVFALARGGVRFGRRALSRLAAWARWSASRPAAARDAVAGARHQARVGALERASARRDGPVRRPVVMAIGAWSFPVPSQRFVYEELAGLARAGFEVRLAWSRRQRDVELPERFAPLARASVELAAAARAGRRDLAWFRSTRPVRLDAALAELAAATGRSEAELVVRREVLRALSFARLAEAARAEYLHGYFFYEGGLAAHLAARLLDLPRGVTCYADHLLDDWDLKAVALQLGTAALVVATSRRIAREVAALCPAAASRTLVKPNAITTAAFPASPRRPRAAADPIRLVTVCRIDPKKGLPVLIEALAELGRRGVAARLEIVGGTEPGSALGERSLAELFAAIARQGLAGSVDLLGWRSEREVVAALGRADLFVAPSIETAAGDKDGIPTALLEAMSSGLPVVASAAGSIAEAIENGVEGLLVPANEPMALAAAIATLARDPELAHACGVRAAATARARFDVAVCEGELADRIRGLICAAG
jgi:colanic acid/amylovoran biosynthesis glycosyltransferase